MFENFCSDVFGMIYKDSLASFSSQCRTEAGDEQDRQVNNNYNTVWQVLLQNYVKVTWEPGAGVGGGGWLTGVRQIYKRIDIWAGYWELSEVCNS